jgi:tetratricopeptide (TPR) repeat protein
MKCFYCSYSDEIKETGFCHGCGKELARFCPVCGIKYNKSAKFCMSCGGKLEDLPLRKAENAAPAASEQPEDDGIKMDFDDGVPRGVSTAESNTARKEKEDFLEIDLGIEAAPEENPGEKTLKVETEQPPERKPRVTIEIKMDDEPAKKEDDGLELDFEKKVAEQRKRNTEPRAYRRTMESIENEKSATDFITKWESSAKEIIKESKKSEKPKKSDDSFDALFAELTSLTKEVVLDVAEVSGKREKEEPQELFEVVQEQPEDQNDHDHPIQIPGESDSAAELTLEIDSAESPSVQPEVLEQPGEISEQLKIESAAASAVSSGILMKNAETYKLHPRQVHETYDVSFDELIGDTITPEFEESCLPMLRKIEQNFKICKGGAFFLRGQSGIGKSRFFNSVRAFADKNESAGNQTFRVVASDANIFDFDFMIFINLIKKLMRISSDDASKVAEKFDSLFGDALPDGKKECLTALMCLNFAPLKAKLPKHDMEYLLAYVLYCLSRNKPVLWVINNANALNVRTVKFLSNLESVFDYTPLAVVCIVDPEATVLVNAKQENIYDFSGFGEERLAEAIFSTLGARRIPADMEKLLREKAEGNMLFTIQLTEYLKDLGLIFEMKGSWRFAKLPDDFACPADIEELISKRIALLSEDLLITLKEITLLNLYSVPREFFSLVSTTGSACVDELVKKGYLVSDGDSVRFASRAIMNALKKMIKIGKSERNFYRNTVDKLAASQSEIASINRHWLLLSYINLGGIVDKKMNSFLFSSAAYMEKLGFFEIAQRSYQTIISSFEADDTEDDFRILPEIKNARLWRIVEPQWAKIFWEKLLTYAKQHFDYHLELLAKSELLLLDEKNINFTAVADIIKKFHISGCYEDEFRLIDKTTDILIDNGNHLEANTFAVRGYKLLRDVIVKSDGKGVRPAEFIYILYIRSACKLSEICIMLKNYPQATEILEEALNYAEKFGASYFKSKIMFLLGKIRMMNKEQWEDLIKDGFSNALISMDFSIIKAFLHFFEENGLENKDWVEPFLEYKNCMNF